MEHDETGCQPAPEAPILCVNDCGFFGSAANMNLCSKCYKDLMMKPGQAELAASSIENIVNGSSSANVEESTIASTGNGQNDLVQVKAVSTLLFGASTSAEAVEPKSKQGPNWCSTCKKRVGLTGFNCRCGNLFCGTHRYSDKHDCPFDYCSAAKDAIAKANPVVKAEKLDKI